MLFVSQEGAVAIAVLIACLEGANFTPINERQVPSAAAGLGVSEDIWSVEDEKRRRHDHPYDVHAIPKNARRAMAKIIEMTQPGRDYLAAKNLPGADRLIVYWPAMKALDSSPSVGLTPSHLKLSRLTWWPNQDEPISFTRIRKTVRVLVDRTPQGHSRATWFTSYIEASEVERERLMTEAVETGLWAVIKNAENHLKMRFERALAMTDTDTTIGGCIDWEHHPLTGQPCGDDFLLCLQCTNAFATPPATFPGSSNCVISWRQSPPPTDPTGRTSEPWPTGVSSPSSMTGHSSPSTNTLPPNVASPTKTEPKFICSSTGSTHEPIDSGRG